MASDKSLLHIDGLVHSFGGLAVVNGFSTTLERGRIVGLIGPNGAGKTTVFNLLCGLYRPKGGVMEFEGTSLIGRRPHDITSLGIGRTFQNIRLWDEMSVLDNLRIAHFSQMDYGTLDAFFRTRRLRAAEAAGARRRWTCSTRSASPTTAPTCPRTFPTGCSAGWRSAGRW